MKNVQRSIDRFKVESRKDQQLMALRTRNTTTFRSDFDPDITVQHRFVIGRIYRCNCTHVTVYRRLVTVRIM